MKLLILLALVFSCKYSFAQEDLFKGYYVVDSNIYRNKVKAIIDTLSDTKTITEFDTLGRKISGRNPYRSSGYKISYDRHADTVLSFLAHYDQPAEAVEVGKYLYNENGKIVLYANCYKNSRQISVQMTKFYYDSLGRLSAKLFYYAHKYPLKISESFSVSDSLFKLRDVRQYFYNSKNQLTLVKQMLGPEDEKIIDSFFYDRKGRLVRHVEFDGLDPRGEVALRNVSYKSIYTYTDSSRMATKYACSSNWSRDEGGSEYVLMANGLIAKEYMIYNKEKNLYRQYEYVYFH